MATAVVRKSSRVLSPFSSLQARPDAHHAFAALLSDAHPAANPPNTASAVSSRGVHLTPESAERVASAHPSPASSLHSSEDLSSHSERRVVRPLYKALLLAVRQLNSEFLRYRTREILSAGELAWIQEHAPNALAAIRRGPGPHLEELVATEFREQLSDARHDGSLKQELGSRLDLGFAALSLVSNRLKRLREHAVDSHSESLTNGIRVSVQSEFNALDHRIGALYHYKVKLRNEDKPEPVQLISRHWVITDFDGRSQQVIGPGVIGQQPVLHRGEEYEYQSFTPLYSKRGTQRGTFAMLGLNSKELFEVEIAPFALIPRS